MDGQNFFEKNFNLIVYIQNDQRVMGIILRYVCWGTHRPTPREPGPPTPKVWVNQGGGEPPPPPLTAPKMVAYPLGSHIG